MRFHPMTLGAMLLFATAAFSPTPQAEPWPRSLAPACTAEAQRCLERLERRLRLHGHAHGAAGIEQALLELQETDPGCALLLRSATVIGY